MSTQTSEQPVVRSGQPEAEGLASEQKRSPLTRRQVLEAALAYVDAHGIDALTMRKLGAALGVEGTALYNHVQGKEGLLDGLVELFWAEVHARMDTEGTWQDVLRSSARSIREVIHSHPQVAPLVCRRSLMSREALEVIATCVAPMKQAGFDNPSAAQAVCAVHGHAYGYALMEVSARTCGPVGDAAEDLADLSEQQRIRRMAQMMPADVPDDLFEIGLAFYDCGTDANFEAGIDLLINGVHSARG